MTLALGMAGAIVMFTLVRGILLRPLPVPDEDRLVVSWRVPRSGLATHVPYRSADVEEIGRASRSFEKITGVGYNGAFEQELAPRRRLDHREDRRRDGRVLRRGRRAASDRPGADR